MTSGLVKLLAASVAASIATAAFAQQATADSPAARAAWGFDRSDLTPHPGVRFGVLGNGMRYALMRNAAPAGGSSVRLRIGAGATMEGERQQGFMHLLEHLIFEGSENLPKGALQLMLAHQGLKRWADFNAFTSYDETVYRLDLPRADGGSRETALMLMREISGRLLFTRRAVDGAKDIVTREIRTRDAVLDRMTAEQNGFFMPGTPIARGSVAGSRDSVKRARPAALRRLYERSYVPRLATLVLVGDFDVAAAEAEIAARFSDWRARAAPRAAPAPPPVPRNRGTEARLFVDPAAATSVTIAAVEPLGAGDAGARRDGLFLEHLGSEMLGRRLARIAARADAPFVSANSAIYDHFSTARLARIEVAARDRDWRQALKAGALELGRALEHGFSQTELDEQLAASRAALVVDTAPATSPALADAIVDSVERRIVFTAPGDRSTNDAYLARVRIAEVNAAFKAAWASPGRLVFVSHDRKIPGAEAAIAAAWTESLRTAAAIRPGTSP